MTNYRYDLNSPGLARGAGRAKPQSAASRREAKNGGLRLRLIRPTGLKSPQTAFTENSMKPMTAILTVAALAILGLAVARPARAEQGAVHPPELDMPDATHGKIGITHKSLLKSDVPGNSGQEVIVWDTEYAPRAINPRHYHPAAITFYVVSGTGIWQEDGKAPLTLKAGDSLFVPAGTTHAHWNPSYTESLRFLEFIAGARDKVRPEPPPHSD